MTSAAEIIKALDLSPHPEGGYYKRIYQSQTIIPNQILGENFSGDRPSLTGIYYLLEAGQKSAWHQIQSDEIWQFISGNPLIIFEKDIDECITQTLMGQEITQGQNIIYPVKAQTVFCAEATLNNFDYSLASCWVSPGFNFDEFKLLT